MDWTKDSSLDFSFLPRELVIEIFSYLNTDEKKAVAQVCTSWRDVCYSKPLWRDITPVISASSNLELLQSLENRGICSLWLTDIEGHVLDNVLEHFSGLTGLRIQEPFIYHGSPNLNSLRILHLRLQDGFDWSQLSTLCENAINLSYLNLAYCNLKDSYVQVIAEKLPQLRSLILSYNNDLTDTAISFVTGVQCRPGLKALEELSLSNCKKLTVRSMETISSHLSNLESLDVTGTIDNFWKLGFPFISQLTSLQQLWVSSCRDESIPHLIKLTSLASLFIDGVFDISESGASRFATMKSLSVLTAGAASNIDDKCMAKFATMQSLKRLSMCFCDAITRLGYASFANSKTGLTHLDISMCFLDDGVVTEIGRIKGLRFLSLGFCYPLSDDDIEYLTKSLPLLESLELNSCDELTDKSLVSIGRNVRNLKSLDVGWCPGITREAVDELRRKLPFAQILRQFEFLGSKSDEEENFSDEDYV